MSWHAALCRCTFGSCQFRCNREVRRIVVSLSRRSRREDICLNCACRDGDDCMHTASQVRLHAATGAERPFSAPHLGDCTQQRRENARRVLVKVVSCIFIWSTFLSYKRPPAQQVVSSNHGKTIKNAACTVSRSNQAPSVTLLVGKVDIS